MAWGLSFAYDRPVRTRDLLRRLKDAPCTDCGERFPPEAMDFDHVTQRKDANVSDLANASAERLLAEVARCELVCANCHRTRTETRRLDALVDAAEDWDVLDACGDTPYSN